MNEERDGVPTSKSVGDYVHTLAKAGSGSIPIVGAAASELFVAIVTPPLEKRRNTWMEEIGERLKVLESKGVDIEALRDNDEFIDVVMAASAAAVKTASTEKREALRNSVINTALGQTPDESLAQVFISLVDSFTEWHLKILKLFQDPPAWGRAHGHNFGSPMTSSLASILAEAYPVLKDRRSFYDQVWKDLHQRGLTNTEGLSGMMTGSGAMAKGTSDLGDRLLAFIERPS